MVAQMKNRGMLHKIDSNKVSNIFIKKLDPKKVEMVKPKDTS